jgi:cysteine desulfurase/selenocysteine lyase
LLDFYTHSNANVHRGIYELSDRASGLYEQARARVARFLGAAVEEIVFTSGTTAALNLVAYSYGSQVLKAGDEILVADFEHHSSLLPWQRVAAQTGAVLRMVTSDDNGQIALDVWKNSITAMTKVVVVAHASNVLGTITDIRSLADLVHRVGAVLVVDGAQAAPHLAVDVHKLDCDFYAMSAHKMLGPMGVGALYAKSALLEKMVPYQVGGGMIEEVTATTDIFATGPAKFEAGTPPVAEAIAWVAALDYLEAVGLEAIRQHEVALSEFLLAELQTIKGLRILGPKQASQRTGLVSVAVEGVHAHDLADYLSREQIAVRAGFHCAMPLHRNQHCGATLRTSYYLYNDKQDLVRFIDQLHKAINYYG